MDEIPQSSLSADINTRIKDMEEKQRLLRDRVMLIGKNVVEDREILFSELNDLKKSLTKIQEENSRLKEIVQQITEQLSNTARKEEIMILSRQFDLFRKA